MARASLLTFGALGGGDRVIGIFFYVTLPPARAVVARHDHRRHNIRHRRFTSPDESYQWAAHLHDFYFCQASWRRCCRMLRKLGSLLKKIGPGKVLNGLCDDSPRANGQIPFC